jgi:hypothetical protein
MSVVMRLAACLGLCCWLASGPARAAAAGLHWVRAHGAERCIEPAVLAERVEALTGTSFVTPAAAELSLEGLVEPAGKGFRVKLVSSRRGSTRSAERVLTSKSRNCRELDAAVAFVVALTIDPGLSLAGVPADVLAAFSEELAPEQTLLAELAQQVPAQASDVSSPPAMPEPVAESSVDRAPRPTKSPRYSLGLAAAALSGSAPGWLAGVRGSFGLSLAPRWLLSLSMGAFPNARAQPVASERSATFQSYDAALALCPALRRGRWQGLGCVGVALSYLRARGRDFERNHSAGLWDPAATLALGVGLVLGHGVGLVAAATMRVRFLDQAFELAPGAEQAQAAYRPPRVSGLFSLGPSYEF